MQKFAHVVALVIAYIVWQAIGGIGGLIVAVLAFGIIEVIVMVVLGALSAPFRSGGGQSKGSENAPKEGTGSQ